MQVKFFAVPGLDPADAEAEVNTFLSQHRVTSVDRELVAQSDGVFWLLAITYVQSTKGSSTPTTRGEKIDYKTVLSPDDFQVFAELRRLRKELADRDGVPVYVLFSNKQLATMAQERVASLDALRQIEGVGDARVQKYGESFLDALSKFARRAPGASTEDDARRTAIHLDDVADHRHLCWAFWRAAQGKRRSAGVRAFEVNLDDRLHRLGDEIRRGIVEVGRFRSFVIRDPKRRTIHAPRFRERVLHHALMAHVEPVIERYLVDDTFACRPGKGPLAAARRAQDHARRRPWYLKIDMASYFASIDHDLLLEQIHRRIKGRGVLDLIERIVRSHQSAPGRGLPIGALTSQHFANLYLAPLDRFLLEEARVGGMVRYMDDAVAWSESRSGLRRVLDTSRQWLHDKLRLNLKPSWQLQRSTRGLTFCGFRVWPDRLGVSQRRRRRYREARRRWETAYLGGHVDAFILQRGAAAALGILAGAETLALRRRDLAARPGPEV